MAFPALPHASPQDQGLTVTFHLSGYPLIKGRDQGIWLMLKIGIGIIAFVFLAGTPAIAFGPNYYSPFQGQWWKDKQAKEAAEKAAKKAKKAKKTKKKKSRSPTARTSEPHQKAPQAKLAAVAERPQEAALVASLPSSEAPLGEEAPAKVPIVGPILDEFRKFLERTSFFIQGGTMRKQGMEDSIGWLHPDFRRKLASAFRQAQTEGYTRIGVYSAYRKPGLGIGGFRDKFQSCHAYGLAVDIANIGSPGSKEAIRWHQIAKQHGIYCPYGPHNGAEWNHCQHVPQKICGTAFLRKTITKNGPKDTAKMWSAGDRLQKIRRG